MNPRRDMLRHILIILTKIKEKILKATRGKQQITYKGIPIRLSADFSAETLQARREWHNISKVMKRKELQSKTLYPARLLFRFNGEITRFTDKQKLKRIQQHQNSFTTNAKGTSLGRKQRATTRNKKITKVSPHTGQNGQHQKVYKQ